MEFTIDTEYYDQDNVGEIALLQLCGPVDQKSVPIFEAEIHELFKKDICRFVLDLYNTKYLNSSGLGLLINIAHKVNVVGGGIRLVNVAEKFKVLFDMLGLDSSLPIFENRDAALRSFGSGDITQKSVDEDNQAKEEDEEENDDEDETQQHEETQQNKNAQPIQNQQQEKEPENIQVKQNIEKQEAPKKTLPNLKKNLQQKQESSLKFTNIKSEGSNIYEPDNPVELEDDPNFELTADLSQLADKITDSGISDLGGLSILDSLGEDFNTQEKEKLASPTKDNESQDISISLIEKTFSQNEQDQLEQEQEHSAKFEQQMSSPNFSSEKEDISTSTQNTPAPTQDTPAPIQDTPAPTQDTPARQEVIVQKVVQYVQPKKKPSIERNVQWHGVVEYYNQMRKNRCYPLSLQISRVEVVDNNQEDLEKLKNTNVIFIPRFPGCQVVPERVSIDISSDSARAELWVTPFVSGEIPGWIESIYKGKTCSFTKTPFKIKNNILSLLFFVLSIACLCSYYWSQIPIVNELLKENRIWAHLGLGTILLFTSFGFLRKNAPKVDIVEKLSRVKMQ